MKSLIGNAPDQSGAFLLNQAQTNLVYIFLVNNYLPGLIELI